MARLVVTMIDDLDIIRASIRGVDLAKMVAEKNEMMGRIGTTEQDIIITREAKVLVPAAEADIIDFFTLSLHVDLQLPVVNIVP